MRHAANTHAVDLSTGGVMCGYPHVDVAPYDGPYLTCCRCWRALRRRGDGTDDAAVRRWWPKVYLVTGLRVVRAGEEDRR